MVDASLVGDMPGIPGGNPGGRSPGGCMARAGGVRAAERRGLGLWVRVSKIRNWQLNFAMKFEFAKNLVLPRNLRLPRTQFKKLYQ